MIRQDFISLTLTIIAVAIFLYAATFQGQELLRSLFAVTLALSGLVLSMATKQYEVDEEVSMSEGRNILLWFLVSMSAIFALNLLVPNLPFAVESSPLNRRLFAVLIAVAEEQFFRAFLTAYLVQRLGMIIGISTSGLLFSIYHIAVYGSSPSLLLLTLGAGMALSLAAIRSQRASTTMLAHVLNNFLATR